MGIAKEASRIGDSAVRMGDALYDAVANVFKNEKEAIEASMERAGERKDIRKAAAKEGLKLDKLRAKAAKAAVGAAEEGGFWASVGKVPVALAKFGAKLVDIPAGIAMKPIKWTLDGGTAALTKIPKTTLGIGIIGAATVAGSWMSKRKSNELQNDYANHAMNAQLQAAYPGFSFKNSVTPNETAVMLARQTGGVEASTGHADAVTAARTSAAAAAATPPVAQSV